MSETKKFKVWVSMGRAKVEDVLELHPNMLGANSWEEVDSSAIDDRLDEEVQGMIGSEVDAGYAEMDDEDD